MLHKILIRECDIQTMEEFQARASNVVGSTSALEASTTGTVV
jgi:hypothetical protein